MKQNAKHKLGRQCRHGFTMIEMIVTLVIITIITSVSVVSLKDYKTRSYFNEAVGQVHNEVLKAQSLAMSPGEEDAESYTLNFSSIDNTYTIIQTGGVSSGETIDSGRITDKTTVSDATIIFAVDKGSTNGATSITITDSQTGQVKTVSVTEAGSVQLQ